MSGTVARSLMRRARSAALSTVLAGDAGQPYGSLVTVACDHDGSPILLFSDLSDHTRNLTAEPRAALLFEAASGRANPQTGPRVGVLGRIRRDDAERLRRRFLARHPGAALYAGFADFHIFRMAVDRAHFVGGFARSLWIDGSDLILPGALADAFATAEADVLEHMNADHAEAVDLYAQRLLGRSGAGWRMVAIDPEGCDLACAGRVARLDFPALVGDMAALRRTLVELADQARARPATG
jgi:putative heme iron utilization protein